MVVGVVLRFAGSPTVIPDVAQTFVLYVAFSRRGSAPTHAVFALILGYLCDVLSGAPRGLHAFVLAAIAMLGRRFARRLYLEGFVAEAIAGLVGSFASTLLIAATAVLLPYGRPELSWSQVLPQAFATALVAPLVFAIGRRVDARLGLVTAPLRLRQP